MRILFIDKLKGVAIIFVVMGHVAEFGVGVKDTLFNQFYASFHMPLFMFLSGLFAYKSFEHWNMSETILFVKKKFLRVMLPFFTIGGGYMLMFTTDIIKGYTKTCGVYWFFPALFYCMIAGLILGLINHKLNQGRRISADLALAIIMIIVNQVISTNLLGITDLENIPYFKWYTAMFPFFYFGVVCARYKTIANLVSHSERIYTLSLLFYFIAMILGGERKFTGIFSIIVLYQLFMRYDATYLGSFPQLVHIALKSTRFIGFCSLSYHP